VLLAHTDDAIDRMLDQLSLAERVASQLQLALPRLLSVEDVAAVLGLSARSLRRRLERENAAFSAIVDRVQRERALDLIDRPSMSLKLIAYESGFSSTSGFHRAFRRWTGASPARTRTSQER
jgi:AraC-like DNA-binding protein